MITRKDMTNVFDKILEAFDDGARVNNMKIYIPQDMEFTVRRSRGDEIEVTFIGEEPSVRWHFVPTPFSIQGFIFGRYGGVVRIRNFRDIQFEYQDQHFE